MTSTSRPRVAVLGVFHWHLPLYLQGLADADVVGVWDRDPSRAEGVARSLGSTPYAERGTLLDKGVELAFVFGDPWDMLEDARECLGRRIPFSVEKPAAPSLAELEELVAEVDRAGVSAFAPLVLRTSGLAGVLDSLGSVSALHAHYLAGPPSRYVDGGYRWAVQDSVLGAGCLDNLGPHFVDLFTRVAGPSPAVEYARVSSPRVGDADDRSLLVLSSAEGSAATIDLAYTTPHAQLTVGPSVVLTGSHATLVVTDTAARLLHADGSTSQPCPPLQWPSLFLDYVRAVLDGSGEDAGEPGQCDLPRLADLRDAYRVLARTESAEGFVTARSSTVTP